MDFEYRPSKRKADYKIVGVITEVDTYSYACGDEDYEEPIGFVIKTIERVPKKLYFDIRQNSIDNSLIVVSKLVIVSFWIECRENNLRWYTDLCTNEVELCKE